MKPIFESARSARNKQNFLTRSDEHNKLTENLTYQVVLLMQEILLNELNHVSNDIDEICKRRQDTSGINATTLKLYVKPLLKHIITVIDNRCSATLINNQRIQILDKDVRNFLSKQINKTVMMSIEDGKESIIYLNMHYGDFVFDTALKVLNKNGFTILNHATVKKDDEEESNILLIQARDKYGEGVVIDFRKVPKFEKEEIERIAKGDSTVDYFMTLIDKRLEIWSYTENAYQRFFKHLKLSDDKKIYYLYLWKQLGFPPQDDIYKL